MGSWIFGVLMALLSMAGLFLASRAHDPMLSVVGFMFMAFGLGFIFWLIAKHTGHPHGQQDH
jgi:uncharacterized membrane protein